MLQDLTPLLLSLLLSKNIRLHPPFLFSERTMKKMNKHRGSSLVSIRLGIMFFILFLISSISSTFGDEINGQNCQPLPIEAMIKETDAISESMEGKKWQPYTDVSEIARKYIPVGCNLKGVVTNLVNAGFDIERNNPQKLTEVILKIPQLQYKRFIVLRSTLTVKIAYQIDRIESVEANIYQPNF